MGDDKARGGMRELDIETCLRLLEEQSFGRVAFDDGDGPVVLPVNYTFHRGSVLFRSDLGSKVAAAQDITPAAFEIDHVDVDRRVGWSVLVRGRLVEVREQLDFDAAYEAAVEPYVRGDGKPYHLRIEQRAITGRATPLPENVPPGWYRAAVLGSFQLADDEEE